MKIVNNPNMKTIKDKKLVVGADFAGYPLKEAICAHLRAKGWSIGPAGTIHLVGTPFALFALISSNIKSATSR